MIALNEEFGIEKLRGVCDNATSRIYGFIMYTRKHSYIVKVLRDNDFWNELDEISGANWPIFSIKPLDDGHYARPMGSEEMCQRMVPIWKEPNSNRKFLNFCQTTTAILSWPRQQTGLIRPALNAADMPDAKRMLCRTGPVLHGIS